jgi:hypothetical protein
MNISGIRNKHVNVYAATAIIAFSIGSTTASNRATVAGATPTCTVTVAGPETTVTSPDRRRPSRLPSRRAPQPQQHHPGRLVMRPGRQSRLAPAGIDAAMKALIADKTANSTAREYAQFYTGRDAGQKDIQAMDAGLIHSPAHTVHESARFFWVPRALSPPCAGTPGLALVQRQRPSGDRDGRCCCPRSSRDRFSR